MGSPLLLCVAALLLASRVQETKAEPAFQVEDSLPCNGSSVPVDLWHSFVYGGRNYSELYLNDNGLVSFSLPTDALYPDPNVPGDGFTPLWVANNESRDCSYTQATEGALIMQATDILINTTGENNSTVNWTFVCTWQSLPLLPESENITFQTALITDEERCYIFMSYSYIPNLNDTWKAGFAFDNNSFITLPVSNSSDLSTESNVGTPGFWLYSFHTVPKVVELPDFFYPIQGANELNDFSSDGNSSPLKLPVSFLYFGNFHVTLYINRNGFQSFFAPFSGANPDPDANADIIAPLWTDFNADLIYYQKITNGSLLVRATAEINSMFPGVSFSASWIFITTWVNVPYSVNTGVATFQTILVSGEDDELSFLLMNYGDIGPTAQDWLAGYRSESGIYNYTIDEPSPSDLSNSTNTWLHGQWVFRVDGEMDNCDVLQCSEDEVCLERTGVYGCECAANNPRPNPDTFDAIETCSGSSGTASFSRCQLFEAGYSAQFLHLNDDKCKGVVHRDRVVFHFDYDGHSCGTDLKSNATHFIYENNVQALMVRGDESVISRDRWLNIDFSCVYPLIKSISMPMFIKAEPSVIFKELDNEGSYQIIMVPYPDASFSTPYSGDVTIDVNQQIFIAVDVVGFESEDIAVVLDRCWATPVNDMDYFVYWNLIINECPNPEDGTVQVLQNGVSTSGRFFRMFTFTNKSPIIYLHCDVHLCLVENGDCLLSCSGDIDRRRRRSLDFHDKAAISMSF